MATSYERRVMCVHCNRITPITVTNIAAKRVVQGHRIKLACRHCDKILYLGLAGYALDNNTTINK